MMPDENPLHIALELVPDLHVFLCASPVSGCAENLGCSGICCWVAGLKVEISIGN